MDIHAIHQSFHEAMSTTCDGVFKKYLEASQPESEMQRASNIVVLKSVALSVLRQMVAEQGRDFYQARRDHHYKHCTLRRFVNVRQSLPTEVIQHIISLAYDMECVIPSGESFTSGAHGLESMIGWSKKHRASYKFLLSMTTLQLDFNTKELFWPSLSETHPLKLRICMRKDGGDEEMSRRFFSSCASRLKSLTLTNISMLRRCIFVLPCLQEFHYVSYNEFKVEPNWDKLQKAIRGSETIRLRAATLPSYLLAKFVESGFFKDLTRLNIWVRVPEKNLDHWPSLDQCLATVAQLKKLVCLELEDFHKANSEVWDEKSAFYSENAGDPHVFASLKRLHLSAGRWQYLDSLVWKFASCDLEEISFSQSPSEVDAPQFSRKLSETFPHLKRLRIPWKNICPLLRRKDADGFAWLLPCLETLDVRGTQHYEIDQMSDWASLLRERSSLHSQSPNVKPLNCLCVDSANIIHHEDYVEHKERLTLIEHVLEQIVPNLIWHDWQSQHKLHFY